MRSLTWLLCLIGLLLLWGCQGSNVRRLPADQGTQPQDQTGGTQPVLIPPPPPSGI